MLNRMPLAPLIAISSSGLDTASFAASTARSSPEPCPMAINADPALAMMARTSAKSRLISPRHGNQIGDALNTLPQHVIRQLERIGQGGVLVGHVEQGGRWGW